MFQPLSWDEIPPACYDVTARLAAMDADRVLATLVFPNLPGFAGSLFARAKDKELALVCLRAYNDWVLDEWCTAAPGRFIGLALVPMWDGQLAAAEAERAIAKGARDLVRHGAPQLRGAVDPRRGRLLGPTLRRRERDGRAVVHPSRDPDQRPGRPDRRRRPHGRRHTGAPGYVGAVLLQLAGQSMLLDWLFSGIFQRHPDLTLCLSENGIGWIPAVLQAADSLVAMTRDRVTQPTDPENDPLLTEEARAMAKAALEERAMRAADAPLPSEVFHDHVYGCFIHDPLGLELVDRIGVDNVMIETDFPHNSTWFPFSMEKAQESLAHLGGEDRWKVLRGNAERVFRFAPAEPPVHAGSAP